MLTAQTNARVSGIEVSFAGNATIQRNTIVNPGVRRYDTGAGFAVPTRANAVIQMWSVSSTVVSGNTIKGINTQACLSPKIFSWKPSPPIRMFNQFGGCIMQAQPEAIRMIGGPQAKAYATLCNNVQTDISGNKTNVPLSLWNKVATHVQHCCHCTRWKCQYTEVCWCAVAHQHRDGHHPGGFLRRWRVGHLRLLGDQWD